MRLSTLEELNVNNPGFLSLGKHNEVFYSAHDYTWVKAYTFMRRNALLLHR